MKRTHLIIIFIGASLTLSAQQEESRIDKQLTIFTDVLRELDMSYADTLNYDQLTEQTIHQMLRRVDPYTVYMPEDKTNDLRFMTTGKYGGIGALIMQRDDSVEIGGKTKKQRRVIISDPYEGMPAQKNDVRAGDCLLEVDGKNVLGKTTAEVSSLLRGTPHSIVKLKIQREGIDKPIIKEFEREDIKIAPVDFYGVVSPQVGYISFIEFTEGSADAFEAALDDMVRKDSITSLIIDLRDNGGGIIDEAIKLVNNFVDKGTVIVSTKGKQIASNRTYRTPRSAKYKDMPLAVLVNHSSASASEIVAGSLQDLDRATIIGTRTYGKGLVQSIKPIAYNAHLKVTTAKYYIPSGRCIQAIDYSHRRQDGSVERVPDSLTHEFKTLVKGRTVRDGGGIEPDILIEDSQKVDITYALYYNNLFFDFATRYRQIHDSIAAADRFEVTDDIMEQFIAFLNEKHFRYETETSKYFDNVLSMARQEDIDSTLIRDLEQMQRRLMPSFEEAIHRNEDEVRMWVGKEIIHRYYFNRGVTRYTLRFDKELERAISVVSQ